MGWLFGNDKPDAEKRADINRHAAIKKVQNNYRGTNGNEDATARLLNDARIEAEKDVPWWRR